MSPRQRDLARHALGLVGGRRSSYRNRFVCGFDGPDHEDWMAMVAAGEAVVTDRERSAMCWFALTRAGAQAALQPGESLDPEDFPAEAAR